MDYTACQILLSKRFPREEYWSGFPFAAPVNLPNPRESLLGNLLFFIKQWKVVFPPNRLNLSGAGFTNLALSECLITTLIPCFGFFLCFLELMLSGDVFGANRTHKKHFSTSLNISYLPY